MMITVMSADAHRDGRWETTIERVVAELGTDGLYNPCISWRVVLILAKVHQPPSDRSGPREAGQFKNRHAFGAGDPTAVCSGDSQRLMRGRLSVHAVAVSGDSEAI